MPSPQAHEDPQRSRTAPRPRALRAHERERLVAWLDDGLRGGRRGRLEAEYPLSLRARDLRGHRVVFVRGRPAAHAMLHLVDAASPAGTARLGLIGNVYADPAFRGRGLGQACVSACVAAARERGCDFALLWSDLVGYYAALGFRPGGRERRIALDPAVLGRARGPGDAGLAVSPARDADFAALEALYARKPAHALREPGALARLAAAPEVALRVARRGDAPIGYAACGRGDDLRGVVHEWAGDAAGVLACADALCAEHGASLLLAGPHAEEPAERLVAAGASVTQLPLGLLRPLGSDAGASAALEDALYLWGFDSI